MHRNVKRVKLSSYVCSSTIKLRLRVDLNLGNEIYIFVTRGSDNNGLNWVITGLRGIVKRFMAWELSCIWNGKFHHPSGYKITLCQKYLGMIWGCFIGTKTGTKNFH